ncbi:MAG: glycosyltransferase [Flavobacteriales bacterium]
MRIAMMVSRIPWPLEKGDKLRAYHQLRHLSTHHEVHLFCLSDIPPDTDGLEHLRTITPHIYVYKLSKLRMVFRMVFSLFSRMPWQVHYFFQKNISHQLKKDLLAINPDHVYCQLLRTSEYVKHIHHIPKTLDYMDALSAGYKRRLAGAHWWQRPLVAEEARRLQIYENLIFEYFEHHTIISEQDRMLIFHPMRERIAVVANGVDTQYFMPQAIHAPTYELLFTGNMSYPPNVECACRLALEVLPIVRKQYPHAKLLLCGTTPAREVRALANDAVHVSGWVADMRHAYHSARVFAAPMSSGSGLQNKLLEAMSSGMPCVTTPLAASPVGATHWNNMLVAENNTEIAKHIISLLDNKQLADEMGRQARNTVIQHFSWQQSIEKLEQVWA